MKIQAIYGIINKLDGSQYVGSAVNFRVRKNKHNMDLRNNKHHSIYLQRAYNKYGKDMFEFIILERVENKEDLITREQWWMDNSHSEYNCCKIAGSQLGYKHSEDTKKKISEAKLGFKHTEEVKKYISECQMGENNCNYGKTLTDECKEKKSIAMKEYFEIHPHMRAKKIGKYDLDGNLLEIFESINEAARLENIQYASLYWYINKNRKQKNKKYEYKYMNVVKKSDGSSSNLPNIKEDKIILIDADSLLHQCSYPGKDELGRTLDEYREEEYEIVEMILSERILSVLNIIEMKYNIIEHYLFVKGKNNFRYDLYPEYKKNRPKALPIIEHLCNYIVNNFGAIRSDGAEADDYVYTLSEQIGHNGIIAACDKDLMQIPGIHYNYNSEQWKIVSEEEANYNLAIQLLIGDAGDGVNFTPGFGIRGAENLIQIGMGKIELIKCCLIVYNRIWKEEAKAKLRLCYKLLKLKKMI